MQSGYYRQFLHVLLAAGLSGALLTGCGQGSNTGSDTTTTDMDTATMVPQDSAGMRDTAPAAEQPPGAINPGEDSARFGTGTQDSSRNRRDAQ